MFGGGSSFWPTPTAADAGYFPDLVVGAGRITLTAPFSIAEESGGQFAVANSARNWTILWLILKACGWRPGTPSTDSSLPVRVTFTPGRGSFTGSLVSNPPFYERLMGWPTAWTAPEERVTGFAAWLQRSRGALSALLLSPRYEG